MNTYAYALQVQDACNLSGVLLGLSRLVDELNKEYSLACANGGTADRNKFLREHPALILYLDKIEDLRHRPAEKAGYLAVFSNAYDRCRAAALEHDANNSHVA
jgi:hypothetical protein